jgi:hypothetical protein
LFSYNNSISLASDNKKPHNFEGYDAPNMVHILFEAAPSVSQLYVILLKGINSMFFWITVSAMPDKEMVMTGDIRKKRKALHTFVIFSVRYLESNLNYWMT